MSDFDSIREFLLPQVRDLGGNVEVEPGAWGLFSVPTVDVNAKEIARTLLAGAKFTYASGSSVDDRWVLYYVSTADRAHAVAWLEDWTKRLAGEVRPPSPKVREFLAELPASPAAHRIAQQLVNDHARNEVSAGVISEPRLVRSLLDRLHERDPLYFCAFRLLITNHLIDMIELLRQIIAEDIELKNDLLKGGVSRDPFIHNRQESASEIHRMMVGFFIVNPLDQQKNTTITNPYAAYLDLVRDADFIVAAIDGTVTRITTVDLLSAVRAARCTVYQGGHIADFQTHAPWVTAQIAHPLRFVRARFAAHRELSDLDGLYMIERAVSG